MARRNSEPPPREDDLPPLPPPARTAEGREDQLIAMAFDLVEKRMRDGTASSQETTHFLKQGSVRQKLEMEKLRQENLLLEVRANQIKSQQSSEGMMDRALAAFRGYSGQDPIDPEGEYDPNVFGPQ